MHDASWKGYEKIVKILTRAGADKDAVDKHGHTPLHLAAQDGCFGVDDNGRTMFNRTADEGHLEIVRFLVQQGVELDAPSKAGRTALHGATCYGRTQIIKFLIEAGANKEAIDEHGNTPLHLAASFGLEKVVEILLDAGVNINNVNIHNDTALHLALIHKNAVYALLRAKARVDIINHASKSALSEIMILNEALLGERIEIAIGLINAYRRQLAQEHLIDSSTKKARFTLFIKQALKNAYETKNNEIATILKLELKKGHEKQGRAKKNTSGCASNDGDK